MSDVEQKTNYEVRLESLLAFLDLSLSDISSMALDVRKNDVIPTVLAIPKCRLLGLELVFMDVQSVCVFGGKNE